MREFVAAAYLIAGVAVASPASSAVVTLNYDVTASGFVDNNGGGSAPYDPFSFNYSVTFDNSADVYHQTAGLTVSNMPFSPYIVPNFSYSKGLDLLSIGTDTQPVLYYTQDDQNSFGMFVSSISSSPNHSFFQYTNPGNYYTSNVAATARAVGPGAPAPEIGAGLLSAVAAAMALFLSRMRMPAFASGRRSRFGLFRGKNGAPALA